MCAEPNLYYLGVIHHEMGHVVYYMEYRHLPFYYRTGANGAFHEAIGTVNYSCIEFLDVIEGFINHRLNFV